MAFLTDRRQGRRALLAIGAALLAGCATGPRLGSGPAPNDRVNRVAVLVPLTGPDAAVGRALGNAARLAMVDTGAKSFELTVFDTAAAGAPAAAARALAGGHDLILGPLRAEDVRALGPLTRQARVPVIAFSNDREVAGPLSYVLGFTPGQAVERVVRHAATSGVRRFAAAVPAGDYGQRTGRAFAAAVERSGGQLAGIETYASPAEARAAVARLGRTGYDAILLADSVRTAGTAAGAVRAGARIIGTDLWASASPGSVTRLRGAWYAAPTQGAFAQFAGRYRARYAGQTPPRIASLGYDAVLLAVRAARGWAPGRRFPLGALEDGEGFAGVDGIFRFGPDNVAERAFEVRQVSSSGSTLVAAAPTRF